MRGYSWVDGHSPGEPRHSGEDGCAENLLVEPGVHIVHAVVKHQDREIDREACQRQTGSNDRGGASKASNAMSSWRHGSEASAGCPPGTARIIGPCSRSARPDALRRL